MSVLEEHSPPPATTELVDDSWSSADLRWYSAAVALLVAVITGVGVAAWLGGWRPVGDDAFLVLRAHDVFSANPPLLSTASSGGASADLAYNHPGPLVQYLNAPFVALLGSSAAALGCALINAVSVGAALLLVRRTAPPALAGALLAGTAGLVWAMGSDVLIDPWNPHISTLPFLCAVVATWATCRGVRAAAPVAVVAGSLVAQTHLSMTVLGVLLVAVTLVAVVVRASRNGDADARRGWWRTLALTVGLGVLSALPPLLQQVAHGGDGNVARLLRGSGFADSPTGPGRVLRVIAEVVAAPPWFLRGSWTGSIYEDELLSARTAAVLLVLAAFAVVAAVVAARRRNDATTVTLVVLSVGVLAVGAMVATRFPLRTGVPVPYFRWLWATAPLLVAAVVHRPIVLVVDRLRSRPVAGAQPALVMWVVVAVALSAGTLVPYGDASSGSPAWAQEMADELVAQAGGALDELPDGATVRVEPLVQEASLVIAPAMIEELARRGFDVTMTDPVLVQQSGEFRRSTGDDDVVLVPVGVGGQGPDGGVLIGEYHPFDPAENAALDREIADMAAAVADGEVRLTPAGQRLDATSGAADLVRLAADDPEGFVRARSVTSLLEHGLIEADGVDQVRLADVARRAAIREGRTLSIWLVPGASRPIDGDS